MEAIIFSNWFEPDDEFEQFCKSLGYQTDRISTNFDLMFDPQIVKFCKSRRSKLWGEKVYRGKESYKFKCGFAGAGYFRDIDTTKPWVIKYNHVDAPIIEYVSVDVNEYGHLKLKSDLNKCSNLVILKDGDSMITIPKEKCVVGRGKRGQLKMFLFDFENCDEKLKDIIKKNKPDKRKE